MKHQIQHQQEKTHTHTCTHTHKIQTLCARKPNQTSNVLIDVVIWLFLLLSGVSITSFSNLRFSSPTISPTSPISCFSLLSFSLYTSHHTDTLLTSQDCKKTKGVKQKWIKFKKEREIECGSEKKGKDWIFLKTPPPTKEKNTHYTQRDVCVCVLMCWIVGEVIYAKEAQKGNTIARKEVVFLGGKTVTYLTGNYRFRFIKLNLN